MKPKTLQDAIKHFGNADNAVNYMVKLRWPNGKITCPVCGRKDVGFLSNQNKWQCKSAHKGRQFSAKVGTVFEDSPIPLEKWLTAVWMLVNCRNGVSSYELHRTIGVTQKSAWFMLHRIRLALKNKSFMKLGGSGSPVEVDETFVGGKAINMHRERRIRYMNSSSHHGKTIVMGFLEREPKKVIAKVIPDHRDRTLRREVINQVEHGAALYTDEAPAYDLLNVRYAHAAVCHALEYVSGQVHTNGIENFWSLLKRNLKGTYVAVEPFHLERYVDEQVFRFNNRKHENKSPKSDSERFDLALSQVAGKRLTYAELTGKEGQTTPF